MSLLPHHAKMLALSGISGAVARQRGYWSASKPADLERYFGQTQRRLVPALVVPTIDVRGDVAFHQLRPDEPRVVDGKTRKYEIPHRARMAVDVPPAARPVLADPNVPIVITEGAKKADAAITAGLHAIDLVGVWTWRGRNENGGLTALADFESIALNDRVVYLAFDSDAMQKREVHMALERFSSFLTKRGAHVRIVYLPSGPGGQKTGLDDFLAAGHTKDDVLALAADHLRPLGGSTNGNGKPPSKPAVPAPDTAVLLRRVGAFVRRFVVLPSSAHYLAVSLFVVHSWAFENAHATPYVLIESPEKQSGKTRLLEVLELLCRDAVKVASITAAALFQRVSRGHPTVLIDEADAIFAGSSERNEDLRGVLNAGNAPGSKVIRGGKDGEPLEYDVFCPKVLAGIATGKLPDTIRDRAIVLPMDRKLKSEQVQRLRRRRLEAELEALREQLRSWAHEHGAALADYDLPAPLEKISDRLEEAWEPLLAIADLAGPELGDKARAAAVELAGGEEDHETAAHTLLMALQRVFGDRAVMSTADILVELNADDALSFGGWNDGDGIRARELARLLKRYRTPDGSPIKPRTVRTPGDKTAKGYHREPFEGLWLRYAGASGRDFAVTSVTSPSQSQISGVSDPSQHPRVTDTKTPKSPMNTAMWRM